MGLAVEAAAGADCCLRSISHIARCSSVSDCANASASASGLGSPGGDAFTGDALLPRRRAPFAFDGDNFASAPGWNRFASFMAVSFSVSGINSPVVHEVARLTASCGRRGAQISIRAHTRCLPGPTRSLGRIIVAIS